MKIGLSDCVKTFKEAQLDGATLLELKEDSRPLVPLSLSHRRQLTKYINQCKERDLTLKNAKKKLLAITQNRLQNPPSPPQKDYIGRWDSADEDSDKSWGSDFDDDDEDYDGIDEMNGHCEPDNHTCDDIGHKPKWPPDNISSNLPPQPEIPRRKPKTMNLSSANETTKQNGESSSPRKPPVANKPLVKPKPVIDSGGTKLSKSSSGTANAFPRPPSGFPTKSVRTSISRPTQQPPPPPPNKPKLPELNADSELSPGEEYEVPVTYVSGGDIEVESPKILTQTVSSGQNAIENNSNSSNENSVNVPTISSDLPSLPPRHSPSAAIAPPLPHKPSSSVLTKQVDSPYPVRSCEKPLLLPTKKMDDNGLKYKEIQLKGFGVFKNKLTTLLLSDKNNSVKGGSTKTDSSSSHSGSRASSPDHSVSLSNLCQDTQPMTMTRTRSQEPLGSRETRLRASNHRASLEDGTSMQNRPLPPVPDTQRRPSAPAACNISQLQHEDLKSAAWFHDVERNSAEILLQQCLQSGSYLVRPSRRAGELSPYTLNITYEGKVFHLNIRLRSDGAFALGKEKSNEKSFTTVKDLINYHQVEPILLTSKGEAAGRTRLLFTPQKR